MTRFTLAANNGEIGGGEVMLLRTAKVLRQLGHEVTVVAPALADGVGAAAAKAGFATVARPPALSMWFLAGWPRAAH